MSFVFDQIDAIEKERSQKDETLQRIRTWRESKKNRNNEDRIGNGELGSTGSDSTGLDSGELEAKKKSERVGLLNKEVELVHPWPEWIELMERLVQQNYFDHRRKDEDKMVEDLGFPISEVEEEGFDFIRDWRTVQTACLNFGRDRFDILRSLSRKDLQILVGYGCPSADKKVVFSAKLLRKHVHLDEGDVCSSCSLRSSCERAYLLTNKEDEARTLDVVRVLLTYGFDPVNGSVVNESLLKIKSVKTVVRKLLHEVVKLSAVPIDPNLPPPVIKKPPPKVKQPPPPPKRRVGRDDIEMKKGDWLCPKCDFMNFAKNLVCLQCDAKRPKRQLLPGEWECPQCNFLNYRRNMACFHCEHKRPPDEFMENQMEERHRGPKMSSEKIPSRAEISNAWNFDFDDDESDGADVAAFEYADSQKMHEDFPLDSRVQGENFTGLEDSNSTSSRAPRSHERESSTPDPRKPGMGFNDFDDEEDDDVESYELDTRSNNQGQKSSSIDFSEVEGYSESEDIEGFDENRLASQKNSSFSSRNPSKLMRRRAAFSGSEDDELDFDSADADFGSRQEKVNKRDSSRRDFRRRGSSDIEDEPLSDLESDDEDLHTRKHGLRGNKAGPGRRENTSKGRRDFDFVEDSRSRFSGMRDDKRNLFGDDFNRSSRGSRGNSRGFEKDDYGGNRMKEREGGFRNSKGRGFERDDYGGNRMKEREGGFRNSRGRGFERDDYGGNRMKDREGGFRNSRGRGFERDDYGGNRMKDREGGSRNSGGPRREGFGNRERGRFSNSDNRSGANRDFEDERPRRPRINVR